MTGDTNPTTPVAVEWTDAERDRLLQAAAADAYERGRRDQRAACQGHARQAAARALRDYADEIAARPPHADPKVRVRWAGQVEALRDRADRIEREVQP